jgi:antitoxin (DNA-binding transcriptional repressor) of toxin-antitoxin stability system
MKQATVSFTEAKAHFAQYGRMAGEGQTIVVCKHRRAAFVLAAVPRADQTRPKTPGLARGRIHLAPDFDATPEDVIRAFEGEP